jgi:hypothetical protein
VGDEHTIIMSFRVSADSLEEAKESLKQDLQHLPSDPGSQVTSWWMIRAEGPKG